METINICLITDNNFVLPTATTIESIAQNINKEVQYAIYIICNKNVTEENKLKLSSTENKNISVNLIVVEDDSQYEIFHKQGFPVSISATFKFSIPHLLPFLNKVLYIDGDIIVQSSLEELYSTDVSDVYAGVIKDYHALTYQGDVWERLGVKLEGYFNSGVMLLNLDLMRRDDITEKLIDYRLNGINYYMDQDTLNVVFGHKVKYLDFKYNATLTNWRNKTSEDLAGFYGMEYREDKCDYLRQADIIHYCSSDKPWVYYDTHFADVWLKYFLLSAYRNERLERKSLHTVINKEEVKRIRIQKNETFRENGRRNNKRDVKISVIMPVYNSREYIADAVESVLSSTFTDFELICVDDGSTDNSLKMLKAYSDKDSRVRVLTQTNGGAGMARNNAISHAVGEYVTFLDADDLFEISALEKMYLSAKRNNAQVVISAASQFNDNEIHRLKPMPFWLRDDYLGNAEVFAPEEYSWCLFNMVSAGPAAKLVQLDLIKKYNLEFLHLRKSEDFYFVYQTLYRAQRIAIVNDSTYYRRNVATSLERAKNNAPLVFYQAIKIFENKLIADGVYDKYKQTNINENISRFEYNLKSLKDDQQAFDQILALLMKIYYKELGIGYYPVAYYYNRDKYMYLAGLICNYYKQSGTDSELTAEESAIIRRLSRQVESRNTEIEKRDREIANLKKKNSDLTVKHAESINRLNAEKDKLRKNLDRTTADLNNIRGSVSFKAGRIITFIPRKLRGGMKCLKENGMAYTVKHVFEKIISKFN